MSKQCSEVIVEIQAAIEREAARVRSTEGRALNLLDVGCWDGEKTKRYQEILGGWARGVEVFPEQIARARARGIDVASVDLENGALPWPDESVDVAIVNQVFEHLKNVWLPMSEISRVIKPGGVLVFSVPNLASLHNRVMLGFGFQPSSIRTFGPHVRGFTYGQVRAFLTYGGFFRILRTTGVGFYPVPARWSGPLARAWAAASHTPIFVVQRVALSGAKPPWNAMMTGAEIGEQTFYASRDGAKT